jgi:acyl-CoA reductase-like NAD-dependent aldehyde dehydrogenase
MAKRKNPAAVELGRRGGKAAAGKAQAARWAGTTAEERRAIMRKVIEARWGIARRKTTSKAKNRPN